MSLFGNSARSSSKNLVEFRAGKMHLKGTTVSPDKRKGLVYVYQAEDSLMHFCWKDRTSGRVEDDLIIFPDDCELKKVAQCTTGRVFLLTFKSTSRKLFFWMQEPKTDKDEEFCKKVNDSLNNPPQPGQSSGSGADLGGMDGNIQDLLNNMDQQQLLQLMAGGGLGNLLSPGRSTSRSSRNQTTSSPRSTTTVTPQRSTVADTIPAPAATTTTTTTTASQPGVQLSQLQDILSQMGAPKPEPKHINLADAITPAAMIPILADPKVQERLKPFLPEGQEFTSTEQELRETVRSPQLRQAISYFGSALAAGDLAPVLAQFGLPEAAQLAASKGDVEAFAKAMQESEKKPEEEEHMSVD
uniref:proteasomal ubiquitin receptor ADRM1-like n=1 Tax=Ciona intestinalis TaxID=7719 RepID=UPI00006A67AE|nr:proteasomal ubiquitin receptor ADRM1-like [Ciona intestinalis]|eukprot:XP_002131360.1 proteasomal ubiquitin receptor ADRM1-like [Ciona intestinalis]